MSGGSAWFAFSKQLHVNAAEGVEQAVPRSALPKIHVSRRPHTQFEAPTASSGSRMKTPILSEVSDSRPHSIPKS